MNCIYCQQDLPLHQFYNPPNSNGYYAGEPTHIYLCKPCHSQQDYHAVTGELKFYGFRIKQYGLWFIPNSPYRPFYIDDYSDEIHGQDTILVLKETPKNLTPQNITEEKINLLLLFS